MTITLIISFLVGVFIGQLFYTIYKAEIEHERLLQWIQYKINKLSADCFKEVLTKNNIESINETIQDIEYIQKNTYKVFDKMNSAKINLKLIFKSLFRNKIQYKFFYDNPAEFQEQLPDRIPIAINLLRTYEAQRSGLYLGLIVSQSHDNSVKAENIILDQIKLYENT